MDSSRPLRNSHRWELGVEGEGGGRRFKRGRVKLVGQGRGHPRRGWHPLSSHPHAPPTGGRRWECAGTLPMVLPLSILNRYTLGQSSLSRPVCTKLCTNLDRIEVGYTPIHYRRSEGGGP